MSAELQYTLVDGIKCYSLKDAKRYTDYPDAGFDVTDKLEDESFWVQSRIRLLKQILDIYLRPMGKTRFLEIGCGTGAFIREIVGNDRLTITGSEIYLKGLLYAKKNLPDVEFIQFNAQEGRLAEEFDIIAAFDVLEHIDDDVSVIVNVREMLSDGGHFIVTVPQHPSLWSRLDQIVKHKRRYSRRDLLDKLRQQGFTISYCSSYLFVLFPAMIITRIFDRQTEEDESSEMDFENRVRFPRIVNWIFDRFMRIDEAFIRQRVSLPFGGSLLVVAKK